METKWLLVTISTGKILKYKSCLRIPFLVSCREGYILAKQSTHSTQLRFLFFFFGHVRFTMQQSGSHQWSTCACPNLITSMFHNWSFQESVLWMMTLLLQGARTAACTQRNAVILQLQVIILICCSIRVLQLLVQVSSRIGRSDSLF